MGARGSGFCARARFLRVFYVDSNSMLRVKFFTKCDCCALLVVFGFGFQIAVES